MDASLPRSRCGRDKHRIRLVDFARNVPGPHDVVRIKYNHGRANPIVLLRSQNLQAKKGLKNRSHVLIPEDLHAGRCVESCRSHIQMA